MIGRARSTGSDQSGFTIIELMIASLIFAVILVVITSGIISFTARYYKGIHSSETQTVARNLMDIIAQQLEYGNGGTSNTLVQGATGTDRFMCIGTTQINYQLGAELGQPGNTYGVIVSTKQPTAVCGATPGTSAREMLGTNMRLTNLAVSQTPGGVSSLFTISAGVAYGDTDLLCDSSLPTNVAGGCDPTRAALNYDDSQWAAQGQFINCRPGGASQFCAFSHLSTEVAARF